MAEFKGISCDSCGKVVSKDDATEKLTRFKGPKVQGEYTEDLCADCTVVPSGVTLKPWPKMKDGESSAAQTTPEEPETAD